MEVRCDKCQARYRVDDGRIGPRGLTMRCGKCQNTFKVTKPAGNGASATAMPALQPAPSKPPAATRPAAASKPAAAAKPAALPKIEPEVQVPLAASPPAAAGLAGGAASTAAFAAAPLVKEADGTRAGASTAEPAREGAAAVRKPVASPQRDSADKAPRKGVRVGVAAAVAVLVIALLSLLAAQKRASRPQQEGAKSSVESLPGAEHK